MKKLITIVLLAALSLPVFAQVTETSEQKWTVRGSAAYFPTVPTLTSFLGAIFVGIAVSLNKDENGNPTEKLDINIPPAFQIDALYSFNDRWSAGLSTGYTGCVWKVVDINTGATNSTTFMSFIPICAEGRLNYLNKPAVKLYGSLEAGVMLSVGGGVQVVPDVQLNPIGVEFGKKFFGMVELGVGMNYTGGRIGIGYRF